MLGYDSLLKELEIVEGPLKHRYEYENNKIDLYVLESANGPDVHYRISFNGIELDLNSRY